MSGNDIITDMKNKTFLAASVFLAFCACASAAEDFTRYVNVFIGTEYNGHTFPGACRPFGLVQASPDTGRGNWGYTAGYRYSDRQIIGFTQDHLSGTGCTDLGDLRIFPYRNAEANAEKLQSAFRKETEFATPGYYRVYLDDVKVQAEISATERAAIYRFRYDGDGPALLLVDTQYSPGDYWNDDKRVQSTEESWNSRERSMRGHVFVKSWCDRDWYFALESDHDWQGVRTLGMREPEKGKRYAIEFKDVKPGDIVSVKVALSTVSTDGALANLRAEIPGWDFDGVREGAKAEWNKLLSKASITASEDRKIAFYTSLYHLYVQPNDITDATGEYRGGDGRVRTAEGGRYFSTLSTWDTYRAAHPFYTILTPEYVDTFVNTMIESQKTVGYVPIWTLWGKDNQCMIGTHSIPVMVDAYLKGFRGFDPEAAYAAIKASVTKDAPGRSKGRFDLLDKYGYYPNDVIKHEAVSRQLEVAYDDSCVARLARALGKDEDAAFFERRSKSYVNVFDRETGFMRGRDSSGAWRKDFSPFKLGNDFTEGNSWQYSWHVMQDPEGLVALMGGKEKFGAKLSSLFDQSEDEELTGKVQDVSGLIGQYAHGNEPSHHVIYFFQYADMPRRTAELVREVFDRFYLNKPDGLCGNDDCGQMSAWYVFSAMGFYPFDPCGGDYVIGAPQVDEVSLSVGSGKVFRMKANNLSAKNKYVKSATLNGKPLDGFVIRHADIMAGGELVFEMGE